MDSGSERGRADGPEPALLVGGDGSGGHGGSSGQMLCQVSTIPLLLVGFQAISFPTYVPYWIFLAKIMRVGKVGNHQLIKSDLGYPAPNRDLETRQKGPWHVSS